MATLIVLDSGPLNLLAMPRGKEKADRCRVWLGSMTSTGRHVIVPEIADYEVRRELLRRKATAGIQRLDDLKAQLDYRPITTDAMLKAAELWALLRQGGLPTAGPGDLDADAILAGQALTAGVPGEVVTLATTNVRHLGRFPGIAALEWPTIV